MLVERVEELISEEEWNEAYRDIVDFERMLADDGHVLIKFWLHISKAEQARPLQAAEKDPLRAWQVQPEDWEHHRRYKEYLRAAEEMFERTETEWGSWTIVEATDQVHTWWKVLSTIDDTMAAGLRVRGIDPETLSQGASAYPVVSPVLVGMPRRRWHRLKLFRGKQTKRACLLMKPPPIHHRMPPASRCDFIVTSLPLDQ